MKFNQIFAVCAAVMVLLIPAILGDMCGIVMRVLMTLDGAVMLAAALKFPDLV